MKNIAIATSYRFECVNVLLEILKLNFKEQVKTHVFCNLNEKCWNRFGSSLEHDLIDVLHRIPDDQCYPGNTSRDTKRRQPLLMFSEIVRYFSKIKEDFVSLEGDCYPLDEGKFLSQFERLDKKDAIVNHFDFQHESNKNFSNVIHQKIIKSAVTHVHKMPDGYVSPLAMYITFDGAQKLCEYIDKNKDYLFDGNKNFEGCLGIMFTRSGITYSSLSNVFAYIDIDLPNQIDPVSSVVHDPCVFELGDKLVENNMTHGKSIKTIIEKTLFACCITGEPIQQRKVGKFFEIGNMTLDVKER